MKKQLSILWCISALMLCACGNSKPQSKDNIVNKDSLTTNDTKESFIAVSYTHLDVYKRQHFFYRSIVCKQPYNNLLYNYYCRIFKGSSSSFHPGEQACPPRCADLFTRVQRSVHPGGTMKMSVK